MKKKSLSISRLLPYFALALILLLALGLRLFKLDQHLPELYADETGQFAIPFQFFSASTTLIRKLFIITVSSTWLYGLTPLGVRLNSAIYSALLVIVGFFLARRLSHRYSISLIMALLLAIIPWNFMIGRLGHSHVPLVTIFACLSAYFFLKSGWKNYFFSILMLLAGSYYYPSIIFALPIFLLLIPINVRQLTKAKLTSLIIFALVVILSATFILLGKYHGLSLISRGVDLAIWRDPNTTYITDLYRGLSWNSPPTIFSFFLPPEKLAAPLLYNRLTANLIIFFRNYFVFFSPNWLFFTGDAVLRHSTNQVGAFYPILLPFMLYGAFVFFHKASSKHKTLFSGWILLSPFSAAITKDGGGYLLRAATLLPFLTYFCALGLITSFDFFKTKLLKTLYFLSLTLVFLYSAFYFFFGYFHVYPYQRSTAQSFEYGFKELADFQITNDSAPMLIIFRGPYPENDFYFWQKLTAQQFSDLKFEDIVIENSHFYHPSPTRYYVAPYKTKDVLNFLSRYKVPYLVLPDDYYLKYPTQLNTIFGQPIKTIYYPDGQINFRIFSTDQPKAISLSD